MKIYAPVKDANGIYASVRFVNGVGETDNPRLIKWFEDHGYTLEATQKVEQIDIVPPIVVADMEDLEDELMGYCEKQPDFESMTPIELREWAKVNGFGNKIKNTRDKEKLIKILRG